MGLKEVVELRGTLAANPQRLDTAEGLTELIQRHGSVRAAARALHIHHTTLLDYMNKADLSAKEVKVGRIVSEDKAPELTAEDIDAFIEQEVQAQDTRQRMMLKTRQTEATQALDEEFPCGLVQMADWHIGSVGTDLRLLRDDVALIRDTPGLYAWGAGDYKDNQGVGPHKGKGSTHSEAEGPSVQELIALRFMEQMRGKMLALTTGCHDYWDVQQGDRDFAGECAKASGAVNLWHGDRLHLWLGENCTEILIRHKSKGESGLNTMNTFRRRIDDEGWAAIVAAAHLHFTELHEVVRHKSPVTTLYYRSGGYKVLDEHGQRLGGYSADTRAPLIIVYPDSPRKEAFLSFREGLDRLKQLRGVN
jgi:molybdenum-dependent DNA-binding transcriptional regulator ModE